jgi:hypothetical protein
LGNFGPLDSAHASHGLVGNRAARDMHGISRLAASSIKLTRNQTHMQSWSTYQLEGDTAAGVRELFLNGWHDATLCASYHLV